MPDSIEISRGDEPYFLAASTGGHLAQLVRISRRLGLSPREWLTFDHIQSRSLLASEQVHFVPYIRSRDLIGLFRAAPAAAKAVFQSRARTFVSTGAAVALLVIPIARLRRRRAIYVESVSRFDGPSVTGKILRIIAPGAEFYTQHQRWSGQSWKYSFSLLEEYRAEPRNSTRPRNFFVTLGTIRGYEFPSLIDGVLRAIPEDANVVWQLGETPPHAEMRGAWHTYLSESQMTEAASAADVVISHAGVGSALWLLDLGVFPILVPRRKSRNEHVDDHQEQIARELATRGLALSVEALDINAADISLAAKRRIESRPAKES